VHRAAHNITGDALSHPTRPSQKRAAQTITADAFSHPTRPTQNRVVHNITADAFSHPTRPSQNRATHNITGDAFSHPMPAGRRPTYCCGVAVKWVQAVIDLPADRFDAAAEFWRAASGTHFGDIHPDHDEFVHLEPPTGAMHLELQRIDSVRPGAHLDLLVEDIGAEAERAVALGAKLIAHPGHAVLESPGGVRFCLVPYSGESEKAPTLESPVPHAIDQLCIDVAAVDFGREVAFWTELTGWPIRPHGVDEFKEFETLVRPDGMPIRLLVQRLGPDDDGPPRAHLDLSCGPNVAAVVDAHVELGASVVDRRDRWTVMADPAGMRYCITRSPVD